MKNLKYYETLKEMVSYCHKTGRFTWIVKRRGTKGIYSEAGYITKNGYRAIGIRVDKRFTLIKCHRLAWFFVYGELPESIDHINGDKLDNSISNLRSCNHKENSRNRKTPKNNTSGYKGVYWSKPHKKWGASIGYNRKTYHLGFFDCPKEASEVYKLKAMKLFGEFYNEL